MSVVALSAHETAWAITLGVWLVVAIVVWVLLELLRRTVNDVESAVEDVWTMGKRVAQNTATTHLLEVTKARGGDLVAELERHVPPAERSRP